MGNVEPQVAAASEGKPASGGQIVATMRKQEGMELSSCWHGSAVN